MNQETNVQEKEARVRQPWTAQRVGDILLNNALLIIMAIAVVYIAIKNPNFIKPASLINILSQTAAYLPAALGIGGCIVLTGTDLSAGRAVGITACISASLLQNAANMANKMWPQIGTLPIPVVIVLAMLIGAAIGCFNGFFVAKFKLHPFIVTLGTQLILYTVLLLYVQQGNNKGMAISNLDPSYTGFVKGSLFSIGGTPIPNYVLFAIVLTAIMWLVWNKTTFGKNMFALGSNEEAARVSGVNVFGVTVGVFALAGAMYGFTGFIEGARIGSNTANTGLNYNPQVDLQPIFGAEGGSLKDTLAAEAGGKAEDILATDLVLCITEKAQRVGLQGEYFMSGRIDDLECAYATLYGFLQGRGEEAGRGDIWVMFDNEEVGSSSRQGAQGSLMSDVLARIEESLGVTKEQSIRARTNCLLLSADNGHAIHPNHPEKSDQKLPVNMGGGVILKYNARQTYTTSGLTGAAFTAICEKAGVPVQTFANRADVAGGSTLGNLLGRQILMPMVDIGVGQLAMHSAMETASCKDAEYLANACAAYYNTPIFQPEDGQWKLGL